MKLLTGEGCSACEQAKGIIKANNIEGIEEIYLDLKTRAGRDAQMEWRVMSVPVLILDDNERKVGLEVIDFLNSYKGR